MSYSNMVMNHFTRELAMGIVHHHEHMGYKVHKDHDRWGNPIRVGRFCKYENDELEEHVLNFEDCSGYAAYWVAYMLRTHVGETVSVESAQDWVSGGYVECRLCPYYIKGSLRCVGEDPDESHVCRRSEYRPTSPKKWEVCRSYSTFEYLSIMIDESKFDSMLKFEYFGRPVFPA